MYVLRSRTTPVVAPPTLNYHDVPAAIAGERSNTLVSVKQSSRTKTTASLYERATTALPGN